MDWLSFGDWGRGSFEIGRPRSKGWKNVGHSWTRGVGGLENLDVIRVSKVYAVFCPSKLN